MRIADYLLRRLAEEGVDTIFCVYGAAMGEIVDALHRQDKIKSVWPFHEQAAGFMAEGYAKTRFVPGVAVVTSGPGGGNLVTPIQNCFYDSVPAIFITGQVNSRFMRPDPSIRQLGFQETPIVEIVRPITKYAALVRPGTAAHQIETALTLAVQGRPGPCLLDIPIDVQKAPWIN